MSLVAVGKGIQVAQATKQITAEVLGYDFVGLSMKVLTFQLIALLIAKYIELVNGANSVLRSFLGLLGVNVPNFLPQSVVDFYTTGWNGIKYWDVIKLATFILIFLEYSRYVKAQKSLGGSPSAFTEGVFFLLMGFIIMITVPEIVQRIKDSAAMTSTPSNIPGGTFIL